MEILYKVIERISLRNRAKYAMDTAVEIANPAHHSTSECEGDIHVRIIA